tara:strand:- start:236 stop:847 length:612 start_codon:yes stop_codon:yes gene_type:complete
MPSSKPGTVRIDSGIWRGRYLKVAEIEALRPTKSIVRKTLFNWLRPVLGGAICLDVFAGTGVLGFEAASQGAQAVTFLERHATAVVAIQRNIDVFTGVDKSLNAWEWSFPDPLPKPIEKPFDVVFMDPPFHQKQASVYLDWIVDNQVMHQDSLLYIEIGRGSRWPEIGGMKTYKYARSGGVQYGLLVLENGRFQAASKPKGGS